MSHALLSDRAQQLEAWVESNFLDEHGIVYTQLDAATQAPLNDATYEPGQEPIDIGCTDGLTTAEWINYENCGMTTSAYLQGLLWRYRVTQDPEALSRAHRCYGAIRHIYEIGKQLEPGFFPKIYGGRFHEETSSDQVLYAMLALDHYHGYADESTRREIEGMLPEMVRFWVKRGYRYRYYWWPDMLWPVGRFPSLLLMALRHGEHADLREEYDRLLAEGVNRRPCESQLIPRASPDYQPSAYEQRHHAWFFAHLDTAFAMDAMELDYLLRHDPQHPEAKHWREALAEIWEEARLALAPDGTTYVGVLVDMETGEPRRPDPEFRAPPSDDDKWIGFRYVSGGRSANATLLARAAVQASLHCSDPGLPEAARRIVRSLDASCMRNYLDEDRYIPSLKHLSRYLGGDAVTNWLWAYWQGRAQGIFEPDDTCLPTPALCHGGAAVPEDQATVTNG
jgi:hypothetical protein